MIRIPHSGLIRTRILLIHRVIDSIGKMIGKGIKNLGVIIMATITNIHLGIATQGRTHPEVRVVIIIWEIKTHLAIVSKQ